MQFVRGRVLLPSSPKVTRIDLAILDRWFAKTNQSRESVSDPIFGPTMAELAELVVMSRLESEKNAARKLPCSAEDAAP